ncbi:outer membrane beta-barrel protein [Tenacibaculum sp. 190524A02b]|uniref:outer membrane beta-barrel protein n=1 Tax=Tenacibaculum vairaonense TaxID=3137860 RepID=UPI0031FB54C1
MKKLIVVLLLLSITAVAQKIEVKGQIKDHQNLEVPFASIVFKSVTNSSKIYGTIGEENGSFTIEVPRDAYILEISVVGIEPKFIKADFTNEESALDMGVIKVVTEVSLDEVVIKGNKTAYKVGLDKKTYNVAQDIVAKGGTLTDVMQNLPSVQVESDGNVSIRGDQNVRILIDGKPSGLASSAELFATIPSSSIEKVEVITNPSSKYAAQGTAGIINVVLKKGQKKRLNSSIEVFTGYRLTAGVNANIAQSGETGSWYANAGIGYSEPKAVNDIYLQNLNATSETSSQKSDRIRNQYYYLINIGGTKDFNQNSLSGSLTYRGAQSDNFNTIFYKDLDKEVLVNSSNRDEKEEETNNFINGNLSFEHKFKKEGHRLNFNVSGEYTKGNDAAVISTLKSFPVVQNLNKDVTTNQEELDRYVLSADYVLPMKNNYTLELGYRSDLSSIQNSFSVKRQLNGVSFIIPRFTDHTIYKEKVHAFYGQLSKEFKKLSVKFGLRTEVSAINISSETNNFNNSKNYTNWFPSTFVNYTFNERNKLQFSASRRINRPGSWMIVPFSTFTDERNIFVGNSDINPSYIVATELSYTTKVSNKLSFYPTLYYRKTTDEMEFFVEKQQITIGNEMKDVFTSTIANIGNYTAYGTELGVSYKPFNWYTMYGEIVLNGFKQRGSYKGASFNGDGLMISGRYNLTFTFFKSMKFQIQNFYRGPIETGQYRRKGFYGMNIGISNNLFNGNGSVTFNVRDVFNSNKRIVTTFGKDFTRDLELQYRVRQISLSLTYRFNQKKHKGKQGNQYDDFDIVN